MSHFGCIFIEITHIRLKTNSTIEMQPNMFFKDIPCLFGLIKWHVHCVHVMLPLINVKIHSYHYMYMANCVYLHDSSVIKFDLKNYHFDNLVASQL